MKLLQAVNSVTNAEMPFPNRGFPYNQLTVQRLTQFNKLPL